MLVVRVGTHTIRSSLANVRAGNYRRPKTQHDIQAVLKMTHKVTTPCDKNGFACCNVYGVAGELGHWDMSVW